MQGSQHNSTLNQNTLTSDITLFKNLSSVDWLEFATSREIRIRQSSSLRLFRALAGKLMLRASASDWWAWIPTTGGGRQARADQVRDWHRPVGYPGNGATGFDREATVLVEGECWDSTPTSANASLHQLGFPTVGLPNLNTSIHVSVSISSVCDYLPDLAFYARAACEAVRLSTPLCSYEAAYGLPDSDNSESDMDLSE